MEQIGLRRSEILRKSVAAIIFLVVIKTVKTLTQPAWGKLKAHVNS
jgi:hypothetical protein